MYVLLDFVDFGSIRAIGAGLNILDNGLFDVNLLLVAVVSLDVLNNASDGVGIRQATDVDPKFMSGLGKIRIMRSGIIKPSIITYMYQSVRFRRKSGLHMSG